MRRVLLVLEIRSPFLDTYIHDLATSGRPVNQTKSYLSKSPSLYNTRSEVKPFHSVKVQEKHLSIAIARSCVCVHQQPLSR